MGFIADGANAVTKLINWGGKHVGEAVLNTVVPTALGAIGGRWMTGDWRIGALQGLVGGAVFHWTITPIKSFVNSHKGEGSGQFHEDTRNLLWLVGLAAQYTAPVLATVYAGHAVLEKCGEVVPFLAPLSDRAYTVWTAAGVNVAPAVAQHVIKWLRSEDAKAKRS